MFEKIKYCLKRVFLEKQMRIVCVAVMTAIATVLVTLLNCSIYTVNIIDGENTYTVRTLNKSIPAAISCSKIANTDYEIEKTSYSGNTATVELKDMFPVFITYGDKTIQINFSKGTVNKR